MNYGKKGGFTIVESMLFLAISSFLIIIAMAYIGGRNKQVQFQDSMRAVDQYYDTVRSYTFNGTLLDNPNCRYDGVNFQFGAGATNDMSCTILGYMVDFPSVTVPDDQLALTRIFGKRVSTSEIASCSAYQLACAEPTADPSFSETYAHPWDMKIWRAESITGTTVSAFGYLKLPASGSIVPVAVFNGANYRSDPDIFNKNIGNIEQGGARQSAIAEEVSFVACTINATDDIRGAVAYSSDSIGSGSIEISFEGADNYPEAVCN